VKLRRLNLQGIKKFEEYLDRLRNPGGDKEPPPVDLLDHPETSEALPWDVKLEQKNFQNRFELGQYLVSLLEQCDQWKINFDPGLWSWLALFFFDHLCPAGPDGRRKPDANENYILSPDRRRQYRHALRTTYLFVREYGEKVLFMFCGPAHKRGQIMEDLSARQYFLGCRGVIEAAGHLYYDPLRNSPKRGAAAKDKLGTVRRFGVVLKQFERTYDLFSLSRQQVLEILPREFDRFRVEEEKRPQSSILGRIFGRRP